jgi:hypothetical protein
MGKANSGIIVNIQDGDRLWKPQYLDVNYPFCDDEVPFLLFLLTFWHFYCLVTNSQLGCALGSELAKEEKIQSIILNAYWKQFWKFQCVHVRVVEEEETNINC